MATDQISAVSQLLNYGGLGLLALLCLVVLGHNAWNLNRLIRSAVPARLNAARPLLLAQMGVSVIGLLGMGTAAVYLDRVEAEDKQDRTALLTIVPDYEDVENSYRPRIRVGAAQVMDQPLRIKCEPGDSTLVKVNFTPYINHRIDTANRLRQALPTLAGG